MRRPKSPSGATQTSSISQRQARSRLTSSTSTSGLALPRPPRPRSGLAGRVLGTAAAPTAHATPTHAPHRIPALSLSATRVIRTAELARTPAPRRVKEQHAMRLRPAWGMAPAWRRSASPARTTCKTPVFSRPTRGAPAILASSPRAPRPPVPTQHAHRPLVIPVRRLPRVRRPAAGDRRHLCAGPL